MNLADALSGHTKLEGMQWVLLSAASRRVLRDQLKAMLSPTATLGKCRLRRTKFQPGRKLTALYDALIHTGTNGRYCARPVAVTWRLEGGTDGRPGGHDVAEMEAEAIRRGVAAPFRQLTADLPERNMHVQISPLDARFLALVRLSDPRYVRQMLAVAYKASEVARPKEVAASRYALTSIRYRPGKRHVLRYDPVDAANAGTVFAKLYTGEDGARIFRVAGHVADWLVEHGKGVTAARPLAYVTEDAVILYPRVLGTPLSELLRRGGERVARCLECAGAALHALHHLPEAVVGPLQPHDFAAEVKKAARASDHIPALLPAVGGAIVALLDQAQELHERLPQEPPTFTHGDYKSEHLRAAPSGPTLIDFDSRRLADPAFDVGKFLADLRLWFAVYDQDGLEEAQERFLAGYALGAPEERLIRARLYEAVELVKITARRVRLFDHNWATGTEQLIRRAQEVMKGLELNLGLPATQPPSRGFRERHQARREQYRQL